MNRQVDADAAVEAARRNVENVAARQNRYARIVDKTVELTEAVAQGVDETGKRFDPGEVQRKDLCPPAASGRTESSLSDSPGDCRPRRTLECWPILSAICVMRAYAIAGS